MPLHKTEDIVSWIQELNQTTHVQISKVSMDEMLPWYYDAENGEITNTNKSFFSITGICSIHDGNIVHEQPIIIQNEIGYLGIICKRINGEMHFLMQAKIEPGNINKVQISPTIQATKSNFTQKHGGAKPKYLEYFLEAGKHEVLYDQIQSEQSSRFFKKRNRNIIIRIDEDIEVYKNFMWMTMNQIKELMKLDNLVNMDTRTVLAGFPLNYLLQTQEIQPYFTDDALLASIQENGTINALPPIYQAINNYKMFDEKRTLLIPLYQLKNWEMSRYEIFCKNPSNFKVIYCNIEIEGREVRKWTQPLIEAIGISLFGLFTCIHNGVREFLVCVRPEIGCFDEIEIGPTIQQEPADTEAPDEVKCLFYEKLDRKQGVKNDVLLSEEGGRFYCEQNRNVIIEIDKRELLNLPEGYFWVNYATLSDLMQINNCLNIQLRNLISILEW